MRTNMKSFAIACCLILLAPFVVRADTIDDDLNNYSNPATVRETHAQFFASNPDALKIAKGVWWEELSGGVIFGGIVLLAVWNVYINHNAHNSGE